MRTRSSTHRSPQQRLMLRRYHPDRRSTLRWDSSGRKRRYSTGRRQEDNWDAMKAALMRLWGSKKILTRT